MTKEQKTARDRAWEIKLLQGEILQLEREREHLASKSLERPLNPWETFRLAAMTRDTKTLMKQLSKFTEQFCNPTNQAQGKI